MSSAAPASAASPALRRRHRAVAAALFVVLGFQTGLGAVQLGSLATALRLDAGQLGAALSAGAAGGVVTLLVGGRIADRVGRRVVLLLGTAVPALGALGLAAAPGLAAVVVALLVAGLSTSFLDLGANAVGTDFERAHDVRALTQLQAGFSLGAVIGALASGLLVAAGVDYRAVYAGLAVLLIGSAAVLLRAELPPTAQAPADELRRIRADRRTVLVPGVLFATSVLLVCFFGDGVLEGFLAVFLRRALGSGVLLSGIGVAGFHACSFAGRLLVGGPLARVPVRRVITVAGVLAAAGAALAVLAPSPGPSIAGFLVVGFAISPVVPSALSLAARAAPEASGQAVAVATAVGYSSFLVAPIAVGALATATSLRVGLGVTVATSVLLAALGVRWPRSDVAD